MIGSPLLATADLLIENRLAVGLGCVSGLWLSGTVDWEPKARHRAGDTMVGLRIDWREMKLGSKVKQAGGKWNPGRRIWEMRYDRVVELGLEERIVEEGSI